MEKKEVVFCIPGLGLNRRMFERLELSEYRIQYLNWIEPEGWETIAEYARRLAKPIEICSSEVVIIGHSFGGVMAQEIAKILPVKLIVLISSTMNQYETPWRLRILGRFSLHLLVTRTTILMTFPVWSRTHGYRTRELRTIFRDSVKELSTSYFQWSLKRLAQWNGAEDKHTPIVRIHGTKDLTFPRQLIRHLDHEVVGGDHAMVFRKAEEISSIINHELSHRSF